MFELIGKMQDLMTKYQPVIDALAPKLGPMLDNFQTNFNETVAAVKRIEVDGQNALVMINLIAGHMGIASPTLPPIAGPGDENKTAVPNPPGVNNGMEL